MVHESTAPTPRRRFLIVDDNMDGRSLLIRNLQRKFPDCEIVDCGDAPGALAAMSGGAFDAIVVHRAGEVRGLDLIPQLRELAPDTAIVHVSGVPRPDEARQAGATASLDYDAWLRLGSLIMELLEPTKDETAPANSLES